MRRLFGVIALLPTLVRSGGQAFRYYRDNNTERTIPLTEDGSITARFWSGEINGTFTHLAFGSPALTRLDFSGNSTQFPKSGEQFYLPDNAYFVVITGNATFGDDVTFSYGDMLYVTAGQNIGPIASVGSTNLMLFVVTSTFIPTIGTDGVSTINSAFQPTWTTSRSYRRVDNEYHANPDWPDATVKNMNFYAVNNTPAALRVLWDPQRSIGYHYHPLGALYFVLYGSMYFDGDYESFSPSVVVGEVRWVRPGFAYGPEYNGEEEMEILVLGTEDPPIFDIEPPKPFLVQIPIYPSQVL